MSRLPELTESQIRRYARHIVLAEVGGVGQSRLVAARVLVVGAGGLGSPLLQYLAAAGVGTLGVVDADRVDLSNLQRQVIHATSRIGMAKVDSAEKTINDLNAAKALSQAGDLVAKAVDVEGLKVLTARVSVAGNDVRTLALDLRTRLGADSVVCLVGGPADKPSLVVATGDGARARGIAAGALVGLAAPQIGGRGGGKDDFAQGGGTNGAAAQAAFDALVGSVRETARA